MPLPIFQDIPLVSPLIPLIFTHIFHIAAPPAVAVAPQQLHGPRRLHRGPCVARRQRRSAISAIHSVEAPQGTTEGGAQGAVKVVEPFLEDRYPGDILGNWLITVGQ